MTDTSPGSITQTADFTRAPATDARAASIDLGLIDAVTAEILAHPMALSDPPLSDPPNSIFMTFARRRRLHIADWRRRRITARHRPRSHLLRDLAMLAASAERLRAILVQLDASQHADLMRQLFNPRGLPQPGLLRATRTIQGLVELLDLLAANARHEVRARGGLEPTRVRRRRKGAPAEPTPPIDAEAHLKALAQTWFGREDLSTRLADVALRCGDYRDGLRAEPSLTNTLETFQQARRWADHTMLHLLKFRFGERLELLSYRSMAEARATIEPGVPIDRPGGAARRLRALCQLLLAVGDRGAHSIAEDVAGTRYGRREMSDPADFAVTCCASLWISFRNEPIRGRYPKAGTFSRFVEEFLHDALGIFPASELRSALRRFHDARDDEIRRIAERLQAPRPSVSGSAMEPDAETLGHIRRLLNMPVSG